MSIPQAYLALTDTSSIRVRIIGNAKAFLTIKSSQAGASRSEFEYPIPVKDARALMKFRTGRVIEKRRHVVKAGKDCFEVDVFRGESPSARCFFRQLWSASFIFAGIAAVLTIRLYFGRENPIPKR